MGDNVYGQEAEHGPDPRHAYKHDLRHIFGIARAAQRAAHNDRRSLERLEQREDQHDGRRSVHHGLLRYEKGNQGIAEGQDEQLAVDGIEQFLEGVK